MLYASEDRHRYHQYYNKNIHPEDSELQTEVVAIDVQRREDDAGEVGDDEAETVQVLGEDSGISLS